MFSQTHRRLIPMTILISVIIFNLSAMGQKKAPTAVFFSAYVFEASTNGDTTEFPLLPDETAITTLDRFSNTSQGYIDKFRSIYSFNHFTFLTTLSGAFTVGLSSRKSWEFSRSYGKENHFFILSIENTTVTEEPLLSLRIESQLDTLTKPDDDMSAEKRIHLFKTLCTVHPERPLVIGRPLRFSKGKKKAIFVVFTPFFHKLTDKDQYPLIIEDYRRIAESAIDKYVMRGPETFEAVNKYMDKHYKSAVLFTIDDVYQEEPPPPPPPLRDDVPVFVPHDVPPEPIGGYQAIQQKLYYPAVARKAGIEGRVMVWVQIDEQGKVKRTRIMKSLGHNGIDQSAMQAIRTVKWKPAMNGDKPISCWVAVPVEFKLK